MLTRVFQSGNSIAVRIPKELAIVKAAQDVEIERVGDSLVIRPIKRRKLAGLGKLLGTFSSEFMAQGRARHEHIERDCDAIAPIPESIQEPAPKATTQRRRKR